MKEDILRIAEVFDSIESAKEFIKVNDIKQNQIVNFILVWNEVIDVKNNKEFIELK